MPGGYTGVLGNRVEVVAQQEKLMSKGTLPSKPHDAREQVRRFLMAYQDQLTDALGALDGRAAFKEDAWTRDTLGGGRTRVIEHGDVFEQGGVNFSEIEGACLPEALLKQRPELAGHPYWAAGVSLVLHPSNPYCPTAHINYRYFEAGPYFWFAGGADLTPYYVFEEDARHWHQVHKDAMDAHDPNAYPAFKHACDLYFYNHHRKESRGIGGTFYDYQDGQAGWMIRSERGEDDPNPAMQLKQPCISWEALMAFHKRNAAAFLEAYSPIIARRRATPYGERERQFQLYRRGRYVEFNLLYDRGTVFGLQTGGRVESILMSLPPLVRWQYAYEPESGTPECDLTALYLKPGVAWL
jgi:coproporphyrinogen III oxidase